MHNQKGKIPPRALLSFHIAYTLQGVKLISCGTSQGSGSLSTDWFVYVAKSAMHSSPAAYLLNRQIIHVVPVAQATTQLESGHCSKTQYCHVWRLV